MPEGRPYVAEDPQLAGYMQLSVASHTVITLYKTYSDCMHSSLI